MRQLSLEVKSYYIGKMPEQGHSMHCQDGRGRAKRESSYQIPTGVPGKPKELCVIEVMHCVLIAATGSAWLYVPRSFPGPSLQPFR